MSSSTCYIPDDDDDDDAHLSSSYPYPQRRHDAFEKIQTSQPYRVCLFGLSANPPTGQQGHVGIVTHLSQMNEFDEDKRERLVSFEHRYRMCQLAFQDIPKVAVSDAEYRSWCYAAQGLSQQEQQQVSVGTASLLEFLHANELNAQFTFCLGADAFMDLTSGKWKESSRVFELLQGQFLVIHRPEHDSVNNISTTNTSSSNSISCNNRVSPMSLDRIELLNQRLQQVPGARLLILDQVDAISSSQVRTCRNVNELATMVVPAVLEYMRQHSLFAAFPP